MQGPIPSPLNPSGSPDVNLDQLVAKRQHLAGIIDTMSRLAANEDFKAFTKYLRFEAKQASGKAKDVDRYPTADQRDAFAQRHIALTEVIDFAEGKLEAAHDGMKKIDEKIASLRPANAKA